MYKADIVIFDYTIAAPFILPAGTDTIGTTSRKSTSQTEISLLIQLLFT